MGDFSDSKNHSLILGGSYQESENHSLSASSDIIEDSLSNDPSYIQQSYESEEEETFDNACRVRRPVSEEENSSGDYEKVESKPWKKITSMEEIEHWTVDKSKNVYGVENWGAGYFDINELGHITVSPEGPSGPKVDLYELVNSVLARDIELPVLFRFNGILRHRIRTMYQAFARAIEEHNYTGTYFPAYPIKVNQHRHIVDVINEVGLECNMGLEVGSKPELMAVLGVQTNQNALLLCNGYKDESYIELALTSKKIGRQPIIVIEKLSELALVLNVAERLGVEPDVGLRLRLTGRGSGRWERSGGDRAKFGLTVNEILEAVEFLRSKNKLDAIRLIHFHAGSQLTAISPLRQALKEACQVYVQLKKECKKLDFMDIGGGLGVDYDGSKTNFSSSMNYTLEEYARDVVWILDEICKQGEVPHPHIVTESGRATVAYHSVLVFDVLGIANTFNGECDPNEISKKTSNSLVQNLAQLLREVCPKNCQETLHDAMALRGDLAQQFSLGLVSIQDRALGDKAYWAVLQAVCKCTPQLSYVPDDLESLPSMLTDTYFCNLSIFQSLPDSWAIQQIFPITPVHRLNTKPDYPVVLADITCDSDGAISRFADLRDVKPYLPAHKLKEGDPYYFATFLVGAYQEILGDLHNLFGDTNAVHVDVGPNGEVELCHVVYGDTIHEVLSYVQYDKEDLCERWRKALESAVNSGKLSAAESGEMFRKYSKAFEGYTYLTNPHAAAKS
jgi:arginine decarboxylase